MPLEIWDERKRDLNRRGKIRWSRSYIHLRTLGSEDTFRIDVKRGNECIWRNRYAERKQNILVPRTESEFASLAREWRRAVQFTSSVRKKIFHPAYQRIIGLGPNAVPLLLKELRDDPNHWFWALASITGEDPAVGTETFNEARDAWLEWGKRKGLLPA